MPTRRDRTWRTMATQAVRANDRGNRCGPGRTVLRCHPARSARAPMHTTSLTLLEAMKAAPGAPAWGRFVRLYRPLLEGWALRHGFQPADAGELAQEILSTLLTALPGYERRPGHTFRGWLFGVARNAARNFRSTCGN